VYTLSNGSFVSLNFPNASLSVALGINDNGQIVGHYAGAQGTQGFVYSLSDGAYASLSYPGAVYTDASGINDEGQIVGWYQDTIGHTIGFLATPTPIPGAILLFAPGLVGLGAIRRRFRR
jgi:probable HAF family extracellular repeat protein